MQVIELESRSRQDAAGTEREGCWGSVGGEGYKGGAELRVKTSVLPP